MEVLLILFLLGCGAAGKAALDHASAGYRKSKAAAVKSATGKNGGKKLGKSRRAGVQARHAQGYWASELLHGFPVARTGWHTGWLAHKAAADHTLAQREEARTSHLETRASVLSGLPEHRKRQAEAREQIEQSLAKDPQATGKKAVKEAVKKAASNVVLLDSRRDPPLPSETVGKPQPGPYAQPAGEPDDYRYVPCPDCGAPAGTTCEPDCYYDPYPPDDLAAHLKAPMPDPRLSDRQRERDADGKGNKCAACGNDGDAGDPLVVAADGFRVHQSETTDPASGYYGESIDDEYPPDWLPSPPSDGSPSTNGNGAAPMAHQTAEYTYDQTIAEAQTIATEAEQEVARLRGQRIGAMVEHLAGVLNDPGSLSSLSDIDEALRRQQQAAEDVMERATAFRDQHERDHGNINEAVQSAPVPAAETGYYEG